MGSTLTRQDMIKEGTDPLTILTMGTSEQPKEVEGWSLGYRLQNKHAELHPNS
jgi:hypothetical protein